METTYTTAEAADRLGMSQRQVQRLAGPNGPLGVVRRDPVILLEAASVDAYAVAKAGGPCYDSGVVIQLGDIVTRGGGKTPYRVTEIDHGWISLTPVRGYTKAHVLLGEADSLHLVKGADQ